MMSLQEQYSELLALTQLFLMRECAFKDKRLTDADSYAYFRALAARSTKAKQEETTRLASPFKEPLGVSQLGRIDPSSASRRPIASSPDPGPLNPPSPDQHPLNPPNPVRPDPIPSPITPPQPPLPEPSPKPTQPDPPAPPIIQQAKRSSDQSPMRLEPLPSPAPILDCRELKQALKKLFPHYPVVDETLSDEEGKKNKNKWRLDTAIPPIVILSFNEERKQLDFLKNVKKAIARSLAPARILSATDIERENKWETVLNAPGVRLIIGSDDGLRLLPDLMKHYKEAPLQAKRYLNRIPLLLLSDLSSYFKEPGLKALLWRAIRAEFETAQPL